MPPCPSGYQPKGAMIKLNGMDAYSVGPRDAKLAIVFVYDIFGYHPGSLETMDKMAETVGARVVAPDFFDGKALATDQFPMKGGMPEFMAYLQAHASAEKCHSYMVKAHEALKGEGHIYFGTAGLCWGARVCMSVADKDLFNAGHVLMHPSFLKTEDARPVKTPICALPSKEELDMLPFMAVLQEACPEAHKKSVHFRFDDMHHGWCGARCDWKDPHNSKRAQEALDHAKNFFHNTTNSFKASL